MFLPVIEYRVDALYINGDLWDENDILASDSMQVAIEFINDLLFICKKNNIAIRVVEGTPKHDRKQSKTLVRLNKQIGADLKYLEGINVFHDDALNLSVGTVQDEYRPTGKETTKLFKELMKANGYSKLGIIAMHGAFQFQMPNVQIDSNFDEKVWIKLAKYCICIGHDHNQKTYGIIRVTGSTDCLSHGETGDKGITVVDFREEDCLAYFVVNPHPCPYLTVDGADREDDDIVAEVEEKVKYLSTVKHGKQGRLRVTYPHDSDARVLIRALSDHYNIPIQASRLSDKNKWAKVNKAFGNRTEESVHLDTPTIRRMILERVRQQGPELLSILDEVECRL